MITVFSQIASQSVTPNRIWCNRLCSCEGDLAMYVPGGMADLCHSVWVSSKKTISLE